MNPFSVVENSVKSNDQILGIFVLIIWILGIGIDYCKYIQDTCRH